MSAKKKYFTVNFIPLIHKACLILSASITPFHSIHLPTQCLWFGLVYLFIHSVTYVTLDTWITDYNLQHNF